MPSLTHEHERLLFPCFLLFYFRCLFCACEIYLSSLRSGNCVEIKCGYVMDSDLRSKRMNGESEGNGKGSCLLMLIVDVDVAGDGPAKKY